jgi:hypothetical protein
VTVALPCILDDDFSARDNRDNPHTGADQWIMSRFRVFISRLNYACWCSTNSCLTKTSC